MSCRDHPDNLYCQTALQPVLYEELPWSRDPESVALVPKSRRRAIGSTYHASIYTALIFPLARTRRIERTSAMHSSVSMSSLAW